MRIGLIIQARMGSVRFPGKVLTVINNKPKLKLINNSVKQKKILLT